MADSDCLAGWLGAICTWIIFLLFTSISTSRYVFDIPYLLCDGAAALFHIYFVLPPPSPPVVVVVRWFDDDAPLFQSCRSTVFAREWKLGGEWVFVRLVLHTERYIDVLMWPIHGPKYPATDGRAGDITRTTTG